MLNRKLSSGTVLAAEGTRKKAKMTRIRYLRADVKHLIFQTLIGLSRHHNGHFDVPLSIYTAYQAN